MTPQTTNQPLVFRDNGEWLRWALLAGAMGLCAVVFSALTDERRDVGKIIGGSLGALLLAFSGYVLQVRRLVIDPPRWEVTVMSKGLTRTVTDRFGFDDVDKLQLVPTYERNEDLLPANRNSERWSLLFVLKDRTVALTTAPYVSKDEALRQATLVQQVLGVEISDKAEEGIALLAQAGRIIDAVVTTRRIQGKTLTEARTAVQRLTDRSSSGKTST